MNTQIQNAHLLSWQKDKTSGWKVHGQLVAASILAFLVAGCGGGSLTSISTAKNPPFTKASSQMWVHQFGTGVRPTGEDDQGDTLTGAATDMQGNVVVAGSTTGAFPGFTNASGISQDVVAKYDPIGKQLWLKQFGTSGGDQLLSVAVDGQANIAVGGITNGAFPGFANPAHSTQAVVEKLDSSGHRLWLQQFHTGTNTLVNAMAVDSHGNVLVCGQTGPAPYPYQTVLASFGPYSPMQPVNIFVEKLNGATGAQEWIQQFGNQIATDSVTGIAVDTQGNPVIVGTTSGAFPGNAFATDLNPSLPFILKLSSASGQTLWVQQTSPQSLPSAYFYNAVAVDSAGNVIVDGQGDLQGGPQCLLFKFSGANGKELWRQNFGGRQQALVGGLALDTDGSILVGGYTRGAFLPAFTATNDDIFLAKFTGSGHAVSIQQFGTGKELEVEDSQISSPISVAADAQNNTFVGGMTTGAFPGSTNANAAQEIFLAKFGPQ